MNQPFRVYWGGWAPESEANTFTIYIYIYTSYQKIRETAETLRYMSHMDVFDNGVYPCISTQVLFIKKGTST